MAGSGASSSSSEKSGSRLFRRILGRSIYLARRDAGRTQEEVAERLWRKTNMVTRVERGDTLIDGAQLELLCQFLELDDDQFHNLMRLRQWAQTRPWWSHLGQHPEATNAMLALENLAHRVRQYDHTVIPGLLQTAAYARMVNEAIEVDSSPEQLDMGVELRMGRQAKIWHPDRKLEAVFLIDESVLWRMQGPAELRRSQLTALIDAPENATVQVVPYVAGVHPSMATYSIFDLALGDDSLKGVHVEGAAAMQGVVAEEEIDVQRYELVFERTRAKALSAEASIEKIHSMVRSTKDD